MKIQYVIGADLSKNWIDLACHQPKNHVQIENTMAGFQQMLQWLDAQGVSRKTTLIVMEHTGLYSYQLEHFLHEHQIKFAKVPAMEINKSLGLTRGKNDQVDAFRIARYGFERRDLLKTATQPNKALQRLQFLSSARELLVRQRSALLCAMKEFRVALDPTDSIIQTQHELIDSLGAKIKLIESEMQDLVKLNEPIKQSFGLLTSIKGVGKIVAIYTIIKTGNFTKFSNARKFACFCGIAPFEHRSGKSLRLNNRISHLADKTMKTLLDLAAKSAIQFDNELHEYYQRRLEAGKSKRCIINIVRNKIVTRMFAVINRQTPFVENYLQPA
jgi:transposase